MEFVLWVEDCSGRVADPTNGEVILNVPDRTFRLTKIRSGRGTLPKILVMGMTDGVL